MEYGVACNSSTHYLMFGCAPIWPSNDGGNDALTRGFGTGYPRFLTNSMDP